MLRSMTAFANSEQLCATWLILWELRSVNHRYLDITIRLPEWVRSFEAEIRERVTQTLHRGKIECYLKLQSHIGEGLPTLNRPLAEHLLQLTAELEQLMGPGTGLSVGELLRWPGIVSDRPVDIEPLRAAILDGLDKAIRDLVATRQREGERMSALIRQRSALMRQLIDRIRKQRPQVMAGLRDKLLVRLRELPIEPDIQRLEQELVIAAQRLDIEEELDRLDAHLTEIDQVLERPEPVGRRLDFLMQELHREANTLTSKSSDTDTTRAAVELKVLIEQMREQVQNVE